MSICNQYRVNDEMFCSRCAKVWSVNESKPVCLSDNESRMKIGHESIEKLKRLMSIT